MNDFMFKSSLIFTLAFFMCTVLLVALTADDVAAAQEDVAVIRVIDGDTIIVSHDGHRKTHVRLLDIDTPEIRGKCEVERRDAQLAKKYLAQMLPRGTKITLVSGPSGWKEDVYGRLLAHVKHRGKNIGKIMLKKGFARPYRRGHRINWCGGS